MAGDFCPTKTVTVTIQENGCIRNSHGYLIGRLSDGVDYNKVEAASPVKETFSKQEE